MGIDFGRSRYIYYIKKLFTQFVTVFSITYIRTYIFIHNSIYQRYITLMSSFQLTFSVFALLFYRVNINLSISKWVI